MPKVESAAARLARPSSEGVANGLDTDGAAALHCTLAHVSVGHDDEEQKQSLAWSHLDKSPKAYCDAEAVTVLEVECTKTCTSGFPSYFRLKRVCVCVCAVSDFRCTGENAADRRRCANLTQFEVSRTI